MSSEVVQPTATDGVATTTSNSIMERALHVLKTGAMSHDLKLGVLVVNGTSEPRCAKVFPKATCSCPARGGCYHILAARISVGISDEMPRRKVNLTTLCTNKRKHPDKKSGWKRPCIDDVEVISAADAEPHPDN